MGKRSRPAWQVRVYGEQRKEIEVDLLAQIVIMLGRQLAHEAQAAEEEDLDDLAAGEEEP